MQGEPSAGIGAQRFGAEPVAVVMEAEGRAGERGGGPGGHVAERIVAGGFGDGAGGVGQGDHIAVGIVVIPPWLGGPGGDFFHEQQTADSAGGVEAAAKIAAPGVTEGFAGGGATGSRVGDFLNEVELVQHVAGAGLGRPDGSGEGLSFREDETVERVVAVEAPGGGTG